MNYPLLKEYIQAILFAEDNFKELTHLRPVLDEDGAPVMSSGGFAVVFKMKDEQTGKFYAVKCFLKEQEGRAEAYRMIAEELEYINSTFLTPIKYLDRELFVDTGQSDETEFPVLLMDWVDGVTLDKYIRENIYDEYALSMLAYQFSRLAMWLIPQPFAHGDLKPDNILVKNDGTLVLVDYDGMYVPAMQGQKARELGSPDFRHPSRTETDFDEHIDDFSLASTLLSLKAIALQPERLEGFGASDRLLFSEKDYRNVSQCELLKALFPSDDSEINVLTSLFMIALEKKNLSNVSFRLFDLCRPKEPEYVNLSTEVTGEDLANACTDEFGVKYSKDRKRLLKCDNPTIKKYTIKSGSIVICDFAFSCCNSLSEIHIPDSVTKIGSRVFERCSSLSGIHIPNSVKEIGDFAFSGCSSLSKIHIPGSVITIGSHAFFGCSSLSEIHIPDSVRDIGRGAFSDCDLSEIHIPNSVTEIGRRAFSDCSSLTKIHIPDSVTKIGSLVFERCSSLSGIHIPNSVKEIGDSAFSLCSSLSKIHIPGSVITIGSHAFFGCSSLSEIHIPDSVRDIGGGAFSGCDSITSIFVDRENKYYDSRNHCNAVIETKSNKLVIGCASTIIPDSVTEIGAFAFSGCSSISEIYIPDSVTEIGVYAFSGCSSISEIYIPDSVTEIGVYAFRGCSSLSEIHIPDSVTEIGFNAFSGCRSLFEIHIPDSVTRIGVQAFSDCSSLTKIHIPDSVTKIEDEAFSFCSSLSEIHIPDSVTEIGREAFWGCSSLSEIHIPDSVTIIGDEVFSKCSSLSRIIIPYGSRSKFEEMLSEYKEKLVEFIDDLDIIL